MPLIDLKHRLKQITSLLFIIVSIFFDVTQAQEYPDWVREIILNDNAINYSNPEYKNAYVGLGFSSKSQKEADEKARLNFARNVETKVSSIIELSSTEDNLSYNSYYKNRTELKTKLTLRNISIKKRFYDKNGDTYFTLIVYKKDDYEAEFKDELVRDYERQLAKDKSDIAKKELKLAKTKRLVEIEEEQAKQTARRHQFRSERFLAVENDLRDRGTELLYSNSLFNYSLKKVNNVEFGFNPFTLTPSHVSASFGFERFKMQLNGLIDSNSSLAMSDIGLFFSFLETNFDLYKISAHMGLISYTYLDEEEVRKVFENGEKDFTPSFSLSLSSAYLGYSRYTIHVDKRWISAAFSTSPLINSNHFGSGFSISTEMIYAFNQTILRPYKSRLYSNFGLNFQYTPRFVSRISVREFRDLVISFGLGF